LPVAATATPEDLPRGEIQHRAMSQEAFADFQT
jgi:hypothetical protein